jgi:hypothetical protein
VPGVPAQALISTSIKKANSKLAQNPLDFITQVSHQVTKDNYLLLL